VAFQEDAWEDYLWWQGQDRKTLRRLNALLRAIMRDPFRGEGTPEQLRGDRAGWWSRRIDGRNRIVYRMIDGAVVVAQCRGHYDDR
jgi:toxin YoeB